MKKLSITIIILSFSLSLISQGFDKAKFEPYKAGFYYKTIMRNIVGEDNFKVPDFKDKKFFEMDFSEKNYPVVISDYKTYYHSLPVSQGNSGTCWAYSATSFMESEAYRISRIKVDLSEIYTVYWDYVDRAEDFVKTKGETYISEGSEANAIKRIMRKYGMMPYKAYTGLKGDLKYNDHSKMFKEIKEYLDLTKKEENWNKEEVVKQIKNILDKYIGTPPESFTYNGNEYTPKTFMTDYLKLKPNNYFSFMSTIEFPYNEKHELVEPDNWWHCYDYYNISLDDFINLLNSAIEQGYTISLCGDVSEAGYNSYYEVGVVPDFDIPAEYINEYSRQFRLSNGTTTDDHCIHLVGIQKIGDTNWYLIKDSGSGAFDGKNKGYRFYHEDYIKLKMMNYMINVDVARPILDNIIKK